MLKESGVDRAINHGLWSETIKGAEGHNRKSEDKYGFFLHCFVFVLIITSDELSNSVRT